MNDLIGNDPIGHVRPERTLRNAGGSDTRLHSRIRRLLVPPKGLHGGWHTPDRPPTAHPSRRSSAQLRRRGGNAAAAVATAALLAGGSNLAAGSDALDPVAEIEPFAIRMALQHQIPESETRALLKDARVLDSVLEAVRKPAERMPWHRYRKIFVTGKRIERGAEFWRKHAATLARAGERFGVPSEIIVAIIGVETFYGVYRGRIRVLDALATLGFRYPRRSAFFLSELEAFMLLSTEERLDARRIEGSYAGAMGIAQFISSSYRHYAIDFDGDGSRDLMHSPEDAIGSVANYLSMHGWRPGAVVAFPAEVEGDAFRSIVEQGIEPHASLASMRAGGVGFTTDAGEDELGALLEFETKNGHEYWVGLTNFYVISRYNRSQLYALVVLQLAQRIRERHDSG